MRLLRTQWPLCGLLLLALLVSIHAPRTLDAATSEHQRVLLTPTWSAGVISEIEDSNFIIDDLDNDGTTEIVGCGGFTAYAMRQQSDGSYGVVWFNPDLSCSRVAAADREGDGVQDLFVATSTTRVSIVRGDTFAHVATLTLPDRPYGSLFNLAIGNVDADATLEVVVVRGDATFVYNAVTLALEWEAANIAGRQVAIGNVAGDSTAEIVVNGNASGYVLDAKQRTTIWNRQSNFGEDFALGNLDDDPYQEIAVIRGCPYGNNTLCVLDADTQSTKWTLERVIHVSPCQMKSVAVGDANDDGANEVIVGDDSGFCAVTGYAAADHAVLWSIKLSQLDDAAGVIVGDTDDDDQSEVLWVSSMSGSGARTLMIGSAHTQSVKWRKENLGSLLRVAAGDVDGDGQLEIVMSSRGSSSASLSGALRVFDAETHAIEWTGYATGGSFAIDHLVLGQLDADAPLEIVIGGVQNGQAAIQVFDGLSHEQQWNSGGLSQAMGRLPALLLANVDGDPQPEIIAGFEDRQVRVYKSGSSAVLWGSSDLGSDVRDLAIGELDAVPGPELAVLTGTRALVYGLGTWDQRLARTFRAGAQIAIGNSDGAGAGELLLASYDGTQSTLEAWSGGDYRALWQRSIYNFVTNDISTGNLDDDPEQEFILVGGTQFAFQPVYTTGILIGSQLTPLSWLEYPSSETPARSGLYNAVQADLDGDGRNELLTSSPYIIQQYELSAAPLSLQQYYLPVIDGGK